MKKRKFKNIMSKRKENKKTITAENKTLTNGPIFSQHQLDEAFFHANDILDRALCPFLLLNETARSIYEEEKLQGDGIYLGVRLTDFTESTFSMLRTLASNNDIRLGMEEFKKEDMLVTWKFKGIQINIKLISGKYDFINNPTFAWYYADNYKIPNPFTLYWQERRTLQ